MNDQSLVTIVIPSYNHGRFIEETILSVISQDYAPIELIVIDGGSTDNTVEILKRYSDYIQYWVSEPDNGQADAINNGWMRARGEYLGWINSDDVLLPDAVSSAVSMLSQNTNWGFVYGDLLWIDEAGSLLSSVTFDDFDVVNLVLNAGWISQQGNLFRRAAYESVGELDSSLHFQMDLDYWIRIGLRYPVGHIHKPLAKFRMYQNTKTGMHTDLAAKDILKIYQKLFAMNNLPAELLLKKRRAWANAYSYAAEGMYTANNFSHAYRYFVTALGLSPSIILEKKHVRRLIYMLVLSCIGGRRSKISQLIKKVINRNQYVQEA